MTKDLLTWCWETRTLKKSPGKLRSTLLKPSSGTPPKIPKVAREMWVHLSPTPYSAALDSEVCCQKAETWLIEA